MDDGRRRDPAAVQDLGVGFCLSHLRPAQRGRWKDNATQEPIEASAAAINPMMEYQVIKLPWTVELPRREETYGLSFYFCKR